MVTDLSIGVLGIQGAISEHVSMMQEVFKKNNRKEPVRIVRNYAELSQVKGLIIPGGESTTISLFLLHNGLHEIIRDRIQNDKSFCVMGTCAGCALLASEITDNKKDLKPLSALDMNVKRNAFGRQRDSFEKIIDIKGFSKPYNAFFIRAPLIADIWGDCKVLAKIDNNIVMVRQGNILAMSFHPELTEDLRIHKYFLDIILRNIN